MPRKKRQPLSFVEQMQKIEAAQLCINRQPPVVSSNSSLQEIGSLQERVSKILGIVNKPKKVANRMLFFVMYDIESNKVRTLVHKYLKRMGCTPVQRSIFLADAPIET